MSLLIQRFKFVLPLGGAIAFAGIAGYLYYQLYQKDDEIDDLNNDIKQSILKLSKTEIKIAKDAVGAVIGRQGSNIKQIQSLTSTSINFRDDDKDQRTCIIKGQLENVEKAKELILKSVEDIPVTESIEFCVPNQAVGRIIGRNGTTINSIQRATGAKIKVIDKQNGNEDSEGSLSEPSTKIVIKGTVEQLKAAKLSILEKVDEEQEMRYRIKSSVSNISQRSRLKQNGNAPNVTPPPSELRKPLLQLISCKTFNEVFVSAVESATHFWVQIIGSKTIELDKLVSEMSEYYDDSANCELHIPDKIESGDIVAAKFPADEMWYRGRVCGPCDPEAPLRTVYFVDFGDTDVVDTKDIHELRTDFLTLSFQAVECYLANVDPESASSTETLTAFEELSHATQWEPVMVRVLGYKQEGPDTVPYVRLVDTNGEQDVDVAEELVKRGLASWSEERFTSLSSSLASLSEPVSI